MSSQQVFGNVIISGNGRFVLKEQIDLFGKVLTFLPIEDKCPMFVVKSYADRDDAAEALPQLERTLGVRGCRVLSVYQGKLPADAVLLGFSLGVDSGDFGGPMYAGPETLSEDGSNVAIFVTKAQAETAWRAHRDHSGFDMTGVKKIIEPIYFRTAKDNRRQGPRRPAPRRPPVLIHAPAPVRAFSPWD